MFTNYLVTITSSYRLKDKSVTVYLVSYPLAEVYTFNNMFAQRTFEFII